MKEAFHKLEIESEGQKDKLQGELACLQEKAKFF
jgi:hypothetical protein